MPTCGTPRAEQHSPPPLPRHGLTVSIFPPTSLHSLHVTQNVLIRIELPARGVYVSGLWRGAELGATEGHSSSLHHIRSPPAHTAARQQQQDRAVTADVSSKHGPYWKSAQFAVYVRNTNLQWCWQIPTVHLDGKPQEGVRPQSLSFTTPVVSRSLGEFLALLILSHKVAKILMMGF
ncbi:hypothetical protein WMY93_010988 [Mugilogobius chulae]|uniref:Uncharacterized protein n=1 Tax=Mugilogobius chulae TaxID=88201 RepID=A0AAW0PJ82_9GOBI